MQDKDTVTGQQVVAPSRSEFNPADAKILSLVPSERADGFSGIENRSHPSAGLLSHVRHWMCRHRGFSQTLQEIRSCFCRIALSQRMQLGTSGLVFDQVRESVPSVTFPRSCSENRACNLSIQALEKVRPYLALSDNELFAQAWFQAAKYYSRDADSRLRREQPDQP